MKQINLLRTETQLKKLSKLGDPLVKINELIDWEIFREPIKSAIRKDMSKGGRFSFDEILMFKITMLQQWYGLSDMTVEYHINDSLSYMRFLGLEVGDKVPDGNTIWDFKEALKEDEVDRKLFDLFNEKLEAQGVITHKGSIVDATFVTVPKRHTTKKYDEHLKVGEELEDLTTKCSDRLEEGEIKNTENVIVQIDEESFLSFKDHVKCDSDSKIIGEKYRGRNPREISAYQAAYLCKGISQHAANR